MFCYSSDFPQIKRNLISSIIDFIDEFPHELLNDLRPKLLGNQEKFEKSQVWLEPSVQTLFQKLNFVNNCQKKLAKVDTKLF